ncbi:hypothetical protein ACFL2Q_13790 [Thermodesulfobacteriota bacterium]
MKNILSGDAIIEATEGFISAKKQLRSFTLDLTARSISRIITGGSLDFGGSEYGEAYTEPVEPVKKSPDEPYGWWNLDRGNYIVRFNEKIKPGADAGIMICPHERLAAAGASHSAILVETLDDAVCVTLSIGPGGLAIKENARLSTAMVFCE